MDPRRWIGDHWLAVYLGVDGLLLLTAVLLWTPGSRGVAAGGFVLFLVLLLAFLGSVFTGLLLD